MSLDKTAIQTQKRRLASLKGWMTRRQVTILTAPKPGSHSVEYKGRYWRSTAWYVSPGGRNDAELVKNYMETKTKLDELKVM
jgi:hypothetical protein